MAELLQVNGQIDLHNRRKGFIIEKLYEDKKERYGEHKTS